MITHDVLDLTMQHPPPTQSMLTLPPRSQVVLECFFVVFFFFEDLNGNFQMQVPTQKFLLIFKNNIFLQKSVKFLLLFYKHLCTVPFGILALNTHPLEGLLRMISLQPNQR